MKKISLLRFSCIGIIIIILLSSIGCETNTNPENINDTTDSSVESNTVESKTDETPKNLKQVAEENYSSKKSKLLELVRTNNSSQSLTKRVNKDDYYSELIKTNPTSNMASFSLISDKDGIMKINYYITGLNKPIMNILVLYSNVPSSSDYKTIVGISVNLVEEMHFATIAVKDTTDAVYLMQSMIVPIVPYVNLIGPNKYTVETYTSNFSSEASTSGAFIYKNKLNGVLCKIFINKNKVDDSVAATDICVDGYDIVFFNTNGETYDYDSLSSPSTSSDQNSKYYNEAISSILKEKYTTAYQYLQYVSTDYKKSKELKIATNAVIKAEKYLKAIECYESGEYDLVKNYLSDLGDYLNSYEILSIINEPENMQNYKIANEDFLAGEYEKARNEFINLGEFENSKEMVEKCSEKMYNLVIELINGGCYEDALKAIEKLGEYKDTEALKKECNEAILSKQNNVLYEQYNKALEMYKEGDIINAYRCFIKLQDFKDCLDQAKRIFLESYDYMLDNLNIGDSVFFGTYEQDNNYTNGKEDIEWVIIKKEESSLMLLCKYALDCKPYNDSASDTIWEKCSLRKWLNNDFINVVFDSEEQKIIINTIYEAEMSKIDLSKSSSKKTRDKVFLLSLKEARRLLSFDNLRKCVPTSYAISKGINTNTPNNNGIDNAKCSWWLRDNIKNNYIAVVGIDGRLDSGGVYAYYNEIGVRPVIWICPSLGK